VPTTAEDREADMKGELDVLFVGGAEEPNWKRLELVVG
jgi:hypothetical protein